MDNFKPKGNWGGRRPGAGRKKTPSRTLREALDSINVPEIVKKLEVWSRGKEVICPHCAQKTGCFTADTVALQSAIELLNRRLGKPVQRQEIDITQTIQLSADQIDYLLESKFGITIEDVRQFLAQRTLSRKESEGTSLIMSSTVNNTAPS